MKISIRIGMFETNSSSTHTLSIVSKEEYEKFKKGELIFDTCEEELVKITEEIKKEIEDEDYPDYQTYENLGGDTYEVFEQDHKTKSGDEIVVFGYHGRDG